MREENQSSWEKPLGAELATNKLSTHLQQNQTWATLHWQKMNHVLPIAATLLIVQFWTPSPVTQRWGEKGPGSFVCACSR